MFSRMPLLAHCNLSQNPLNSEMHLAEPECKDIMLDKMSSLILNATNVSWPTLFNLLAIMPNLEELHLSLNNYSTEGCLPPTDTGTTSAPNFPVIHVLHLSCCGLDKWEKLKRISKLFPCLEALVAVQNPISVIGSSRGEIRKELGDIFGCLHSLNASGWLIDSWEQIDLLRHLPLLSELRIRGIPLLEPYEEAERRHLVIARLPDVTLLNGSVVTRDQRIDAERYFLRNYAGTENKSQRYYELESIHGQLDPLAVIDLSPKNSAEVVLVYNELEERRRIGLNQTVGQIKKSLQGFCGLPARKFRLFYRDKVATAIYGEVELKFPKKLLWTLNIRDGDELHIEVRELYFT